MGTIRTAIIVTACIAPSAAFNIWPRLAAVVDGSAALDGETAAFLIFQTAAVVIMALCLPAMDRARGIGKKLAALSLAIILGLINFTNALEVASHSRDSKADGNRGSMDRRAALERQLADLTDSRNRLPRFTPATPAMETAALEAVTAAQWSREDECKARGPNCREREGDERKAREMLVELQGRLALTKQADEIEADLGRTRKALAEIGAAPKHEDGAAHRLAKLLRLETETVMEWWPIFQAVAIEALALIGPYILLHERRPSVPISGQREMSRRRDILAETAPAAVEKTAVKPTPATAAKSRKPKKTKGAAVTPARDWYENRTAARPGNQIRPADAYEDYKAFAAERGEGAMSLTAFGIAMRDEIGLEKTTNPSKRSFYVGIALVSKPVLAVVK
jgi:hypothetical protein